MKPRKAAPAYRGARISAAEVRATTFAWMDHTREHAKATTNDDEFAGLAAGAAGNSIDYVLRAVECIRAGDFGTFRACVQLASNAARRADRATYGLDEDAKPHRKAA